jgi:hypothetical protein
MITALLRDLSEDKFKDILDHSPKQVREMIFNRLGIKKKPTTSLKFVKPGEKNEERARALFGRLRDDDDEEVSEELLRNYFLKRRPLLAAALDAIGVPHDNGLTDHELDKFEKLPKTEARALEKKLSAEHDPVDVNLYLRFMKCPLD